jgi:hypothetical protein
MRKIHVPESFQNIILRMIIGLPQHMASSLLINLSKHPKDQQNFPSPTPLSLGYVLVALRPADLKGKL